MEDKAHTPYKRGTIHFSTEGRLLQELGERLVASPELAITELIKNAYDADAAVCNVSFPDNDTLLISDSGHGMTFTEFKQRWMIIATSSKQLENYSRIHRRKLTGSKGIGRFAVRYIGNSLTLISIAFDDYVNSFTRLEADFSWQDVDKLSNLEDFEIPYQLFKINENVDTGTELFIKNLRSKDINKQEIRTKVLQIVSPISGLERGKFGVDSAKRGKDPGFTVNFLKGFESDKDVDINLAKNVLDNCWAKLIIFLDQDKLKFDITFNYSVSKDNKEPFEIKYPNQISNDLFADIRFFPRRGGIFLQKGIDGTDAWDWVKKNAGVGIVDHGFRLKPYGFKDDDWLNIDTDHSHSTRDWRTPIMKEYFPITAEQKKRPSLNPMLNIPVTHQLIGAVFVESSRKADKNTNDLIPAMDREGFLHNKSFVQLQYIVRAGLEFLALKDKEQEEKRAEKKAREATKYLRRDLREAIKELEQNESIPESEKNLIIERYSILSKEIEYVDEYHRTSKENLEMISLLGIVSGYMTHETEKILNELKRVRKELESLSKQFPQIKSRSDTVGYSLKQLENQIGYTTQFIYSLHNVKAESFQAKAQIEYVLDKFGDFAQQKGIQHFIEIDEDLRTPRLHVAMYSGVFLNLYTNAVKAILMKEMDHSEGKILVRAVNFKEKHIIEVFDNGVGIPESLRERIWDPLFSTTSRLNSPLGTGMGLGLSLVKKVVNDSKGAVKLVDPVKDYVTAIRVEYLLN